MASLKYACPISGCNETRATQHFATHFLSHDKSDLVKHCGANLKLASTGMLLRVKTKVSNFERHIQICLGCKKLYGRTGLQMAHREECINKEKHKQLCKELLSQPSDQSEPVIPTADTSALEQEIAKLKKENDKLKKQQEIDEAIIQRAEATEDCLMEVLSELQETNFDLLKEHLIRMRDSFPEVFKKQMKNLDLDEVEFQYE
jgi:hypothetical protein